MKSITIFLYVSFCLVMSVLTTTAQADFPNKYVPPTNLPVEVILGWDIPTTKVDGTSLPQSDIAGYELYYYKNDEDSTTVVIADGLQNTATVVITEHGTYHFGISTVNKDGEAGPVSDDISAKTVGAAPAKVKLWFNKVFSNISKYFGWTS